MAEESGLGLEGALKYSEGYYEDKAIQEDWAPLIQHCPGVFVGYMTLRKGLFGTQREGGLSPKMKELVAIIIELIAKKTNPVPAWHAKKAVKMGATVAEVAETVSLAIMLGGMITYRESGRFVLKAAMEQAEEMAKRVSPRRGSPRARAERQRRGSRKP